MSNILEVKNLNIKFETDVGTVHAVRGAEFEVEKGKTLAIVGESGSGKSVTSKAIMKLLPLKNTNYEKGNIIFNGADLMQKSEKQMEKIRGKEIAMVFQDPMTALNPTMTIGNQVAESIVKHKKISKKEALVRTIEILKLVGIPNPEERIKQYPHQFSGGMRQRVVIAIAIACEPKLLIADEPTTALDVTIQAQILELLKNIQKELGMSIIIITHDLGVVANIADKVVVMYAGKIIEKGTVNEIFNDAMHPYTWGLLKSVPDAESDNVLYSIPGSPPDLFSPPNGDAFAPRNEYALKVDYEEHPPMYKITKTHSVATWLLHPDARDSLKKIKEKRKRITKLEKKGIKEIDNEEILVVKDLKKHFLIDKNQVVRAVDGINLTIRKGETFGLVGESGCGKSTVGRTILGLYEKTSGTITYKGINIDKNIPKKELFNMKKSLQMIFQDPYASLDPRKTVLDSIAEGIDIHEKYDNKQERIQVVLKLLKSVGLNETFINRYPHEFSGGQRQRIGIARALALEPELIIADEPISALDVSIQAQVINLLKELQIEKKLTFLFIAHDISMVKYISDRIGVMYLGNLVEVGPTKSISKNPLHPYTKALMSSVPIANPEIEKGRERIILKGDLPSPVNPPTGCKFRTRCPFVMDVCSSKPEWREVEKGHFTSCHLYK